MGQQEVSSSTTNGPRQAKTVQQLVQSLLSPLQAYCAYTTEQGSNLQTLQLCLHNLLVTMQALYQYRVPVLAQLRMPAVAPQSGRVEETREHFALRYQCWQCLREIEAQSVRLLPWGHMVNAILTTMLDQLERLPEPQPGRVPQPYPGPRHATVDSWRAGHELVAPMKSWLDMYMRQPLFMSILGQSGLAPSTLQGLDVGFTMLLRSMISMLEEVFPTVAESLVESKHVQAMALLNLLQQNDLFINQVLSLQYALSLLRHQSVPAGKTE